MFLLLLGTQTLYAQNSNSTITIESADKTEYRKNPTTGDEEIILTGAVSISVSSGSSKTTITASKITYTRATDMLFAQGGVTLKQTGGSAGEQNVTADTLLFNTSTLEGVFDNGRVVQTETDAINLPSGSTLIVASEIFGRDSSSTIAFKNANLTFCDDPDPHWKIWASRIWLLPGGEFAFANAVFFVGRVPLLWLPAFYYPKDDLVFNPSFGYDERLGYYIQTTIYLFGRKPLDSSSDDDDDITAGLFNFMKSSSLKEQKLEGLVLHNLDEDYSGNTTNYLKIMADYYTTLGAMVGFDGVYKPSSSFVSDLEGSVQLGFSNVVFPTTSSGSTYYLPYASSGTKYQDYSNFLGIELPFRYSANIKYSMSKPFSFSLSMPIYSDPYFTDDFGERSEYLDWIGLLTSSYDDDDDTTNTVSSFTWSASGSYSATLPSWIKPYVTTLSLSSFSSSIVFSSKANTFTDSDGNSTLDYVDSSDVSSYKSYSPLRYFFYPSQIIPLKLTAKLAGSFVDISSSSSSSSKTAARNFPLALEPPSDLAEAKENAEKENAELSDSVKDDLPSSVLKESSLPELTLPSGTTSLTTFSGFTYNLAYSVTPTFTSQITYDSSNFDIPEDFDFTNFQSTYYQIKIPTTLTSKLTYRDTFISMSNMFSFDPLYQTHPSTKGYEEGSSSLTSLRKADYKATQLDLSNTNTISFRPFLYNTIFKNTGLDWTTKIQLVETEFLGDAEDWEDNPQWKYITPWDYLTSNDDDDDLDLEDLISSHTLSATLSAVESTDFSQVLTLTTTLPPQEDEYDASLKFVFPYSTLSFATGIEKVEDDDETVTWEWDTFQQAASLKLFSGDLSFTESLNYEIEDSYWSSLKLALTWKNLQAAYTMSYTYGYDFDSEEGWVQRSDKEFLPYSVSLAYASSGKTYYRWKNRITFKPTLSTSIVYDCLRPTNSYFKFIPALTFKINDFLDLTFSSESKNSVIFRYIQNYVGYEDVISGETNPVIDLLNSFAFWGDDCFYDSNQTKRKSSGFKLKSLSVSLTHDICDWDFSATLTFKPRLETDDDGQKYYNYHPYFTLSVVWRPMSALKTEIVDEYGEWELNP